MVSRRHREANLPGWLWFFLALPVGLIITLLYRQRRLPQLSQLSRLHELSRLREILPNAQRPKYAEPDSIPLNMSDYRAMEAEREVGVDEEDVAAAKAAGSTRASDAHNGAARMDYESPATANESSDIAAEERTHHVPKAPRTPEDIREANVQASQAGQADDLKIIEGIGPSIAGILRAQGITTFRQLADTPRERLMQILTDAGLNYLANPETWAEQAYLAAEGRMDDLKQLQSQLKGGRRTQ